MSEKLLERIEREAGVEGLVDVLAERLAPTDLQSLLLEVYRRRAAARRPRDVLADHERNRFVRPAAIDARALAAWEACALEQLPPGFDPVVLSPLAPLGTCSVLATVDQRKIVSTARGSEVVSDSTNVLALEAACRRRGDPGGDVHLAALHRLVRAQFVEGPRLFAHFHVTAALSSGRDRGTLRFELPTLLEHLRFHLRSLRAWAGPDVPLRVRAEDLVEGGRRELFEELLLGPLGGEFPDVPREYSAPGPEHSRYYRAARVQVDAEVPHEGPVNLADAGCVDWTAQLLSNRKERTVISGMGTLRAVGLRPGS